MDAEEREREDDFELNDDWLLDWSSSMRWFPVSDARHPAQERHP